MPWNNNNKLRSNRLLGSKASQLNSGWLLRAVSISVRVLPLAVMSVEALATPPESRISNILNSTSRSLDPHIASTATFVTTAPIQFDEVLSKAYGLIPGESECGWLVSTREGECRRHDRASLIDLPEDMVCPMTNHIRYSQIKEHSLLMAHTRNLAQLANEIYEDQNIQPPSPSLEATMLKERDEDGLRVRIWKLDSTVQDNSIKSNNNGQINVIAIRGNADARNFFHCAYFIAPAVADSTQNRYSYIRHWFKTMLTVCQPLVASAVAASSCDSVPMIMSAIGTVKGAQVSSTKIAPIVSAINDWFSHQVADHYKELLEWLRNEMAADPHATWLVTGHSLGGWLSQAVAVDLKISGASFCSPGLGNFTDFLTAESPLGPVTDWIQSGHVFVDHGVAGDLCSMMNRSPQHPHLSQSLREYFLNSEFISQPGLSYIHQLNQTESESLEADEKSRREKNMLAISAIWNTHRMDRLATHIAECSHCNDYSGTTNHFCSASDMQHYPIAKVESGSACSLQTNDIEHK